MPYSFKLREISDVVPISDSLSEKRHFFLILLIKIYKNFSPKKREEEK